MREELKHHYGNIYTEDGRLSKDNKHKTEFLLTVDYVDKYLEKGMRILELGAATGVYSLYYAKKGYRVDALEPFEPNLGILKSRITKDMNVNPVLGDALDLSIYEDNTFDMVLNFGPMYHVKEEERVKCIEETVRVTKPNGLIYIAYISNNFVFVQCVNKFDMYMQEYKDEIKEGFRIKDRNNVFFMMFPDEAEELFSIFKMEKLHHLTTDGISTLIKDKLNSFTKYEFEKWLEYLRHTAERGDQLGYGEHLLYIARKNTSN